MKNTLNKVLLSVLGVASLCGLVSCNQPANTNVEDNNQQQQTQNHESVIEAVDNEYFIKDSKTDYQVVVPENLTTNLKYARDELVRFVEEATGVKLSVINDTGKTHSADQKFISIGDTNLLKSITVPEIEQDLGRDGTRILTVDKTIYIFGKTDIAALYGVYDFLNDNFNFEAYSPNCYTLNKGLKSVKFKQYNVVDIPDIAYRVKRSIQFAISSNEDDVMFSYRMRQQDILGKSILPIHKSDSRSSGADYYHNSLFYIPYEQYGGTHPEYFSTDNQQLCYTGRGNESTVNEMVEICANKVIQSLKWYTIEEYPQINTVQLGVMDTNSFCQCSACRTCRSSHNGADSAAVIIFLNKVGVKVNEWMAKPENAQYKRDLTYMFLAYQKTLTPPYTDVNNIPSDIIPSEGVKIMPFCALSGFNYGVSFYDASNADNRKAIELWGSVYPNGWAWSYGGFFHDYIAYYDMYGFYDDYHAYLKKYNFSYTFEQIHDAQRGAESGFHTMAQYVVSKKSWNTNLCVTDLINNYMHAMYGEAYPQMNEILTYFKLWFARLYKDQNWGSSSIQKRPSYDSSCTSLGFVRQALDLFDDAYEAIEVYKDDPVLYQKYLDRVDQEWLFIGKTIISCYQDDFTSQQVYDIKIKFRDIVNRLGLAQLVEFVSITGFLDELFK